MNILLIGSGGREHALAWKLAQSARVAQVFAAPGNPGIALLAKCSNVAIAVDDLVSLRDFALAQQIELTVVGPEVPLAAGVVDVFQAAGLPIFGPMQAAAQLESSKAFCKQIMRECGVPTADFGVFDDYENAIEFTHKFPFATSPACVVKADGLAAGKGVVVCDDLGEVDEALTRIMIEHEFGTAGQHVVIEERLSGREASVLAFCDGKTVALMPPARDHKRVGDGDTGPNTGGMGAYAPAPDISPELMETVRREVIQPVVDGMATRGTPYVGVLYAGLMLTSDGLRVLEFNCRFGDPETQVLMPLLASDLAEVMLACVEGRLDPDAVMWHDGACATVVLASPGYPGAYPKGLPITGLTDLPAESMVFHAGTAQHGGEIVTSGGRVLAVSGLGADVAEAVVEAYEHAGHIHFEGMYMRTDIGAHVGEFVKMGNE